MFDKHLIHTSSLPFVPCGGSGGSWSYFLSGHPKDGHGARPSTCYWEEQRECTCTPHNILIFVYTLHPRAVVTLNVRTYIRTCVYVVVKCGVELHVIACTCKGVKWLQIFGSLLLHTFISEACLSMKQSVRTCSKFDQLTFNYQLSKYPWLGCLG